MPCIQLGQQNCPAQKWIVYIKNVIIASPPLPTLKMYENISISIMVCQCPTSHSLFNWTKNFATKYYENSFSISYAIPSYPVQVLFS